MTRYDAFISYSSKDEKVANQVCEALEQHGAIVWMAPRDVTPGASYGAELIRGIEHSNQIVLVFSGNSFRSPAVRKEVERAVSKGKTVIPVILESIKLDEEWEYYISSAHWLDASKSLEDCFQRLSEIVLSARPDHERQPDREQAPTGDADEMAKEVSPDVHAGELADAPLLSSYRKLSRSKRILFLSVSIAIFTLVLGFACCHFRYPFWNHIQTDDLKALTEYRGDHVKSLRGMQILVHRSFEPMLQRMDAYAGQHGLKLIVLMAYGSESSLKPNQKAGYAVQLVITHRGKQYQGDELRNENLAKLPENIAGFIEAIREDRDLRWGGDFYKEDPNYFDSPLNLNSRSTWEQYAGECQEDYSNGIPRWKFWK